MGLGQRDDRRAPFARRSQSNFGLAAPANSAYRRAHLPGGHWKLAPAHPSRVTLSIGHFYLAHLGHFHLAATPGRRSCVRACAGWGGFQSRGSPLVTMDVLNLGDRLNPGDSGGPILHNGVVVAVANGGIAGGAAGLNWAVLWSGVELKCVSDQTERLTDLKNHSSAQLFRSEGVLKPRQEGMSPHGVEAVWVVNNTSPAGSFYLTRTETTRYAYSVCHRASPDDCPVRVFERPDSPDALWPMRINQPKTAERFCAWLGKDVGKGRLPTESEWHHAATVEGSLQASDAPDRAEGNFRGGKDGYPVIAPVARFSSNALGVFDLFGA